MPRAGQLGTWVTGRRSRGRDFSLGARISETGGRATVIRRRCTVRSWVECDCTFMNFIATSFGRMLFRDLQFPIFIYFTLHLRFMVVSLIFYSVLRDSVIFSESGGIAFFIRNMKRDTVCES